MRVSIRDFRANISKLLDEERVEITRSGKVVGVYTSLAHPVSLKKSVYTTPKVKKIYDNISNGKYACGCKKIDGQVLCKKHWRS